MIYIQLNYYNQFIQISKEKPKDATRELDLVEIRVEIRGDIEFKSLL